MSEFRRLFTRREMFVIAMFILVVVLGPVAALFIQAGDNRQASQQNQGYLRYLACVADVRNSAKTVTISVEKLDKCWDLAEQQAGVDLPRYYDQVK